MRNASTLQQGSKKFSGASAWEREFGFLKEFGLECVYLTILLMAGSKSGIRYLVGLLPEYAQLLREDVIKLEEFWQEHLKRKAFDAAIAVGDERWALERQCPDAYQAAGYYLRALRNASEVDGCFSTLERYVLASPTSQGKGCYQFSVAFFGTTFPMACELIIDPVPQVLVRIKVSRDQLTEKFTFGLLELPQRSYQVSVGADSLIICLKVDDCAELLSGVSELSEVRSHPVATTDFLQALGLEICKRKIAAVCNIQPRFTEEN